MTNAQAALIAAASQPSHHMAQDVMLHGNPEDIVLARAARYKTWLDDQDAGRLVLKGNN